MATKLTETQRVAEGWTGVAYEPTGSVLSERLSNFLKRRAMGRLISLAGDALALVVAQVAAKVAVNHLLHVRDMALSPHDYVAFYLPFMLTVLFIVERNQRPELRRPEKELELAVKGVSLVFMLLLSANFVVFKTGFSRYMIVSWYLLTIPILFIMRYGIRKGYNWLWRHEIGRRKTLLIGAPQRLFELQTQLAIQRYRGYELLGIVPSADCRPEKFESGALPVLGSFDQWYEAAQEHGAEQIIVALEERTPEVHGLVFNILKRCLADGIDVQMYSDLFASSAFNYEFDEFSGFFRFFAAPRWSKQVQLAAKCFVDFMAGVVGSLLTVAVLPVVGFAIKWEDKGPVFYRREFVERDGSLGYYLKFRTMRTNSDYILEQDQALKARFAEKQKLVDDPRVTRVGRVLRKYSIDELPQFFSILNGQLSLVGPRAIGRDETPRYGECLPKLLSVKAGLTGFWQVMGRQLTTYPDRIRLDMFYIDHWSIWLDLWIVLKTFWTVVRAEGAY